MEKNAILLKSRKVYMHITQRLCPTRISMQFCLFARIITSSHVNFRDGMKYILRTDVMFRNVTQNLSEQFTKAVQLLQQAETLEVK